MYFLTINQYLHLFITQFFQKLIRQIPYLLSLLYMAVIQNVIVIFILLPKQLYNARQGWVQLHLAIIIAITITSASEFQLQLHYLQCHYDYITWLQMLFLAQHTFNIRLYFLFSRDVDGVSIKDIFGILQSFYMQVLVPLKVTFKTSHIMRN